MNGRGRVYTIRRTENKKNEGTDQLIDEGEDGEDGEDGEEEDIQEFYHCPCPLSSPSQSG
jgi:hypothetical protein